ncbi:amidohydrolase 2 [Endogone sp. FLAS-F59071]|nr:amidohydrolase 2 [Endogone sp. FLAS-F59071]|eukprot:RUS21739.1 amidohydrolase 2 [Endogone sp. FLAS-F59071]
MPDFSIVDSHVHLQDPSYVHIPWTTRHPGKYDQPLLLPQYNTATAAASLTIDSIVYVETDTDPASGLAEAFWINSYAESVAPQVRAIVAFAPVYQGDHLRSYLDILKTLGTRIKGVRYLLQDPERDPTLPASPEFVRGCQILAEYGYSFDITIHASKYPEQFPPIVELIRRCPETQFVLDHAGKPPCNDHGRISEYRVMLKEIASYPNVVCKISGLVTEAAPEEVPVKLETVQPFLEAIFEEFGLDRVMFGGDWPIVEINGDTYKNWAEIFEKLTKHLSERDKRKVWNENARKVYRL